jgi:hypothetical protein
MPTRRRSDGQGAAPAAERERDRRCCGASEVKPIIRRLARWIAFGLLVDRRLVFCRSLVPMPRQ